MNSVDITDELIIKIHKIVYYELKTPRKINKFVKDCKKLNKITNFGNLNKKINELIYFYDNEKNLKFNRDHDDFYFSDIEYIIFYYFKDNDFAFKHTI